MSTVTKHDLAKLLLVRSNMFANIQDSYDFINIFFDEIMHSLSQGDDVKLPLLGNFEIKFKNSRIGRNPKTKEDALIPARKVVKFKASNTFRELLHKSLITNQNE